MSIECLELCFAEQKPQQQGTAGGAGAGQPHKEPPPTPPELPRFFLGLKTLKMLSV